VDDWATAARTAIAAGEAAALVTILATEGSAPRGAGTRMLVCATRIAGTIGGGALEHQAIGQARALLDHPVGSWRVQDYPLGPLLGQCCGGRVRLLVEHVDPAGADWIGQEGLLETRFGADRLERLLIDGKIPADGVTARGPKFEPGDVLVERLGIERLPVLLFGAGHVGRAVARAVEGLPIQLGWFDTRAESVDVPGVTMVDDARITDCVAEAPADSAILIMTHDHGLDYRLTVAALASSAGFVGLIGSETKRARFLARLARDGVDAARLTCPVGLAGIMGKEPAVIAVSVAAQLLQLQAQKPSPPLAGERVGRGGRREEVRDGASGTAPSPRPSPPKGGEGVCA
jgi:xanthine dehydrogenase accessory factor